MTPTIYQRHGLDKESLKTYWTSEKDNPDRTKLQQIIGNRLRHGVDSSLRDHKIWWAVDLAYDAPFSQVTPTLLHHILSRHYDDSKDVLAALKKWGMDLDEVVTTITDRNGAQKSLINVPIFYKVLVPLVKSYLTIRRAKLFNDRNLTPLFKYEPVRFTLKNRVICEIVTDIVGKMSTELGYAAILRQAILQALQYGICLAFPQEEWFQDIQITGETDQETVIREGLRYNLPHPSRMGYDKSARLSTINTDTGINWAFYWFIDTYGNIRDVKEYWNLDRIPYGTQTNELVTKYNTYFTEVSPCSMSWPSIHDTKSGAGEGDRENTLRVYINNDEDKAIFRTEFFMKLRPVDYGMGTYPHKTWMRFAVAADNTVIWCSPVPYNPIFYMGYDADDLRSRNAGLSLEVLPFQDHVGNLLSQYVMSVRQNLTKAVFYDTDQINNEHIEEVRNLGHRKFQGVPYIPFSSRQTKVYGAPPTDAFHTVDFPIQNTGEIASAINMIISVLERLLVLSSQEIGQSSTHELTAEETRLIATSTNTRVTFTGTFIDDAIDAWKKQLYTASRAYLHEIKAQLSTKTEEARKVLKELGFTISEDSDSPDPKQKLLVSGKADMLELESIASTREGEDRINSTAIATSGIQLLTVVLNNPMTAQAIGPKQALDMITQFAVLAGLPRDFKLELAEGAAPQDQMKQVQEFVVEAAAQIKAATLKDVEEGIAKPMEEQIQQVAKNSEAQGAVLQELIQKMEGLIRVIESVPPAPRPSMYDNQPNPALAPGVGAPPQLAQP